jgi:hypothetical protein
MGKHINTFNNFSLNPINENWDDNDYFRLLRDDTDEWMFRMIDVTDEDLKVVRLIDAAFNRTGAR